MNEVISISRTAMALKLHSSLAVHPGDWLKTDFVELLGASTITLAERLGVSPQTLSKLLNGKVGLSKTIALRIEKAFGVKAETLMRMQATYDLTNAHDRTINRGGKI